MDRKDYLIYFLFGLTTGIAISSTASFISQLFTPHVHPTKPHKLKTKTVEIQSPLFPSLGSSKESAMQRLEAEFIVTPKKLQQIVKHFVKEMQRGLAADDQTLRMIPSYVVRRATGNETGTFLALDLGGSNFRVCEVELEGKGQLRMLQKKFVVSDALKTGKGTDLFDFFASSIAEFFTENDIKLSDKRKLGFTFSFPCKQTSLEKGYLIEWTKGFTAQGVEGQEVGKLLQEALERQKLSVHVSAIVNDTVGALISHSYSDPSTYVGVILGTGSNAAYVERIDQIPKWNGPIPPTNEMVINMEWGSFDNEGVILPSNQYDHSLDRASANPQKQKYEKMMSGLYLGEIMRLVLIDLISTGEIFEGQSSSKLETPYSFETANLSRIERDHSLELSDTKSVFEFLFQITNTSLDDRRLAKRIAELIGTRAARLSAAGIIAIVTKINRLDDCTVAVDGSLFSQYPHFANRMKDGIRELVGITSENINIVQAKDGSGQGAALIAALS